MPNKQNILIIGAGLCGSLLALRLGQRGFNVNVYEMRPDLRKTDISAGRSKKAIPFYQIIVVVIMSILTQYQEVA